MAEKLSFLSTVLDKYSQMKETGRLLVGIAGPPASGKSYWAERLPNLVNERLGGEVATHFAMDGYHFYDKDLHRKGTYPYKGSHFTFDVQAFIEKLIEIKELMGEVKCPIFDRSIDEPVQGRQVISAHHKIVFVEGNYLLSKVYPWCTIKYLLCYSIYIKVDPDIQFKRLMDRHKSLGKNENEALEKIHRTDWLNTLEIEKDMDRANHIFIPNSNE